MITCRMANRFRRQTPPALDDERAVRVNYIQHHRRSSVRQKQGY